MSESVPANPRAIETLLWAEYPDGRYGAVVQSDGRAVYFAVQALFEGAAEERVIRWTWVRNLCPAPLMSRPPEDGESGLPLVPDSYSKSPKGLSNLDLEKTKILWFEQGIGAALVEKGQVLAIIPPQPNGGVAGYAADCRMACNVALPLEDDDLFLPLLPALVDYWRDWNQQNLWPEWQAGLLSAYQNAWGDHYELFATDSKAWPPLQIAKFELDGRLVLATLGMSIRCQPMVERELINFVEHQRIELAVELPLSLPIGEVPAAAAWLAGIARYPWHRETCFLPAQTLSVSPTALAWASMADTDTTATADSQGRQAAQPPTATCRLAPDPIAGANKVPLLAFRGTPVNLLWLTWP